MYTGSNINYHTEIVFTLLTLTKLYIGHKKAKKITSLFFTLKNIYCSTEDHEKSDLFLGKRFDSASKTAQSHLKGQFTMLTLTFDFDFVF